MSAQYNKQVKLETIFENGGRFSSGANGTASSVAFNTTGATLHTGTDTTGRAFIRSQNGYNGYSVFDRNPEILFVAFLQADSPVHTDSWDAYLTTGTGLICGGNTVIDTVDFSFFGFHIKCVSGVGSVYASTNIATNAVTETLLDISGLGLGTTPFENNVTYYAKLTSGQKIDYYINGVLLDTETTNLPTGNSGDPFDVGILKNAGSDDQVVQVLQARFAFDQ